MNVVSLSLWTRALSAGLLVVSALAGCGGGGGSGGSGAAAPEGGFPVVTGSSPITLTANTPPATFAALTPQVTIGSVTINSPPVVRFAITDADKNAIIGFGNTKQGVACASSRDNLYTVAPQLANLQFSLAKLVPATATAPSRWVSYIVTTAPSKNKNTGADVAATAGRPSSDSTGTLVDNGNGTYQYSFARDITTTKAQVTGMTDATGLADLGGDDLTYDPNAVHRLTIQVSGDAWGSGKQTKDCAVAAVPTALPMLNPVDAIYDFIPATGKAVTAADPSRDITATANCNSCHRKLGGIPGDSLESSGAAFHGGGRNEVRYCVVCHTEQRKYGQTEAVLNAATNTFKDSAGGSDVAKTSTYRVNDRPIGNLPNLIHKIHMGKGLAKQNYNYAGVQPNEVGYPQDVRNCTKCHDGTSGASATSSSSAPTVKTAQGDNWKTTPSVIACGGCHDGINFKTSTGVTLADAANGLLTSNTVGFGAHGGGLQADDSKCSSCHTPGNIDIQHTPVTPPNEGSFLHVAGGLGGPNNLGGNNNTNAAWIASNTSRLPAGGIKVSYDIKSVSRNSSMQPVMEFRLLQNGAKANLKVFDTAAYNLLSAADKLTYLASHEIWDNFMGAPSIYFVFAVPQDGITAPADFNASASAYLRSIWNGTATGTGAGALTGPDGDGYYKVTLTGVKVPDNAVMLTGGVGFSYGVRTTLPLTQTNLVDYPVSASPVPLGTTDAAATALQLLPSMPNKIGGLIVIAPNAQKVASAGAAAGGTGGAYAGRRPIVEDARCNACHQELGTFTEDAFHAGQRNDGTSCSWCHNPNRTSSGWSADSASFVHSIHAANKRTGKYTWHATQETGKQIEGFYDIAYPGVLAQCETCHLPGTYDFSAPASASAMPNRLYRTVANGILNGTAGVLTAGCSVSLTSDCMQTALGAFSIAPDVVKDNVTNYGSGFTFNAGLTTSGGVASQTARPGAAASLVNSPTTTACFACHDSTVARLHMTTAGTGSIYAPRSTALGTVEQCSLCHGPGKVADIKVMHSK